MKVRKVETIILPSEVENREYRRKTSFLYGGQTQGRVYKDLVTEFVSRDKTSEDNALKHIKETLKIFGNPKASAMSVLDIGTGRHSIRFNSLGIKEVTHFDVSEDHVIATKKYCEEHGIKGINSILGDLTLDQLPEKKFDLIYAAGIFQHIQIPALGLINFAQSLKVGGNMYMGFYRSGEFRWFVSALIRAGVTPADFAGIKNQIAISYALGSSEHFQVSRMIDDFFVPSQNCFHPDDILSDLKTCGFKVVSIDPDRREYNHEGGDYFTVGADRVYVKKVKHYSYKELLKKKFRTIKGIDQLEEINYDKDTRATVDLWYKLIDLHKNGFISNEAWHNVLINLYRFARPWEAKMDDYYTLGKEEGRHKTMQKYFRNLFELFNS